MVLFVRDDLDEARPLGPNRGMAIGRERELANLDVVATLARLGFGQPDMPDLWVAPVGRRHLVVIDGHDMAAGQKLGGQHTFGGCDMREPGLGDTVPDGEDRGNIGLHHVVDFHVPPLVGFDADLLQANVLVSRVRAIASQFGLVPHFCP